LRQPRKEQLHRDAPCQPVTGADLSALSAFFVEAAAIAVMAFSMRVSWPSGGAGATVFTPSRRSPGPEQWLWWCHRRNTEVSKHLAHHLCAHVSSDL